MNCQECRDLFDDMLDRRITEPLKRRMLNHLTNCPECSAKLDRRRKAHTALFRALNHFDGLEHLSSGFADRLVVECRHPLPWWHNVTMPKWALIAASLVAMASFVFAATVVVDAVIAKDGDNEAMEGTQAIEGADGSAASAEIIAVAEVPNPPSVSSNGTPPTTANQQQFSNNQPENEKGETIMSKAKAAAAALTAVLATAPLAAANGDEYQFIVSGYPAANPSHSMMSEEVSIETGALRIMCSADTLEARSRTRGFSMSITLNAQKWTPGVIISFR